jgi:hypothetical protein
VARRARKVGPPPCTACGQDAIRGGRLVRPPRAVVRVGLCREPYVMALCEHHLAQARRLLPAGGVWVIEEYPHRSREVP